MLNHLPERLTGISHPMIECAYLKKNIDTLHPQDVLILETRSSTIGGLHEEDLEDSPMMEFLGDLEMLRLQAEAQVGHIDRIEIRRH
jgi:hypothetical protein